MMRTQDCRYDATLVLPTSTAYRAYGLHCQGCFVFGTSFGCARTLSSLVDIHFPRTYFIPFQPRLHYGFRKSQEVYSVRGLERSELGGSHGCPVRLFCDFYDRSTGTMVWAEYRPVIKIGPRGALGSHEIRPIHSAPSLGQSIVDLFSSYFLQIQIIH